MGLYRCARCKQRFEVGTEFRRLGPSRYCSPDCVWESGRRKSRTVPAKPKPDPAPIPAAVRSDVMLRDGGKCRWCGKTSGLHLHHIKYRSEGVDHSPHNLITLCGEHHALVHSDKRTYQPLLRAYIWSIYVMGRRWLLPALKKRLEFESNSDNS